MKPSSPSSALKVNYRTSRQIREAADRLLPPEVRDADGLEDSRRGAMSVFDGPSPIMLVTANQEDEIAAVAAFLRAAANEGIAPGEISIFVRATDQLPAPAPAPASLSRQRTWFASN